MLQGKAYFVGVEPGDIELITRKGYQLICQADVILHDHLIPPELMQLAKTKGNRENVVATPRGCPELVPKVRSRRVAPICSDVVQMRCWYYRRHTGPPLSPQYLLAPGTVGGFF